MRGSAWGARIVGIVASAGIVAASAVSCGSDGAGDEVTSTAPAATATTTEEVATSTESAAATTQEATTTISTDETTTVVEEEVEIGEFEGSWEATSYAITSTDDPTAAIDVIALGAVLTAETDTEGRLTGRADVPESLGGPVTLEFEATLALVDHETMAVTFDPQIPPLLTDFTGPFTYDDTTITLHDEDTVFDFGDGAGEVPATAEVVLVRTPAPAVVPLSWTMEQEMPGELDQVVTWSEGFAGLMDIDGGEINDGGEIWYSPDGIGWAPEAEGAPRPGDDVFTLVGRRGDLFALSGDWMDSAADKTLWHRRAGDPWEVVRSDPRLELLAVGDDRMIAYGQNGFDVVGVFDTATSDAVEYTGLPEIDLEPVTTDASGEAFVPVLYQGRAIALDDGFLAHVSWVMGPGGQPDIERRLFFSEDASTWIEHPSPPDGPLVLQHAESAAPVHDGVNLLYAGEVSPAESWLTDDGLEFRSTSVPEYGIVTSSVVGFVAVDPFRSIHRSTDGLAWVPLEAPPTWDEPSDPEEPGFVRGTVIDGDDRLLAISVHGVIEGFGTVVDPTTEIWSAPTAGLVTDS